MASLAKSTNMDGKGSGHIEPHGAVTIRAVKCPLYDLTGLTDQRINEPEWVWPLVAPHVAKKE